MKKVLKDIFYIIRTVQKLAPKYLQLSILESLLAGMLPFVNIIFGAIIIDQALNKEPKQEIIKSIIIMTVLNILIGLVRWGLNKIIIVKKRIIDENLKMEISKKAFSMDYQVYERTETLGLLAKALEGQNSNGGMSNFVNLIGICTQNIIIVISSFIILGGFFKTSKEALNPFSEFDFLFDYANSLWNPVVLIIICIISIITILLINNFNSKLEYEFFEKNVEGNRKFGVFFRFLYDYSIGKDVRIYNFRSMINNKVKDYQNSILEQEKIFQKKLIRLLVMQMLAISLIEMVSFLFIGLKAVFSLITIGNMMLYGGALTQLARGTQEILNMFNYMIVCSKYLKNYNEFLGIENEKYEGTLPVEKRRDNQYELEFRNVSFSYPDSDELILKNVNLKLFVGSKLAIVGKNGAGKSTFIKLLCRLYDPTEGEILLNGIDIKKYDYDEYRDIFSMVFQDFSLFSLPIGENVAASTEYNEEKVWEALEKSGAKETVKKMKDGVKTVIYKEMDEGVEISGGEAQKIAIARALYRNAPVVILDEPTAALDPKSELEIYERFNEMVNEKTSIYISHRMSSCKFCNNIIVFDKGDIVQRGTHHELLNEKEGLYKKMWYAQAKYYNENIIQPD